MNKFSHVLLSIHLKLLDLLPISINLFTLFQYELIFLTIPFLQIMYLRVIISHCNELINIGKFKLT